MISKSITDNVHSCMTPDRIFLVGYMNSEQQPFNIFHGHIIKSLPDKVLSLDLLIVGVQPKQDTMTKIANSLRAVAPATFQIISPETFNQYLKNGVHFAVHTVKAGVVIFEKRNTILSDPNYIACDTWKLNAGITARHIYSMADEFFKCADIYRSNDFYSPKLSLYFLRQAFELYLRSALTGLLGMVLAPSTNTRTMLKLSYWCHPEIRPVLVSHTKKNQFDPQFFDPTFAQPPYEQNILIEASSLRATRKKIMSLRNRLKRHLIIDTMEDLGEPDQHPEEHAEDW